MSIRANGQLSQKTKVVREPKSVIGQGNTVPIFNYNLQQMCGMLIYKLNSGVETIRDECSGVGVETSATPKYETV